MPHDIFARDKLTRNIKKNNGQNRPQMQRQSQYLRASQHHRLLRGSLVAKGLEYRWQMCDPAHGGRA